MPKQKFKKGDLVHVAKDLGSCMSHFENDVDAVVIGSYKDKYGGSNTKSYTLHLKGQGEVSWYEEHQLTLIEHSRTDILKIWKAEEKAEEKKKSNLDWIFKNGISVLKSAHGSTVSALASCLGCSNLWGSHGEGFVYYQNARSVLAMAKPFLEKSDKVGWLEFSEEYKKKRAASMPQEAGPKDNIETCNTSCNT